MLKKLWLAILREPVLLFAALGPFIAIVGVACMYAFVFRASPLGGTSSWGEFGDYFGGILNPILGYMTVIILVTTLISQRKELEIVRSNARTERLLRFAETILVEINQRLMGNIRVKLDPPASIKAMSILKSEDLQSIPAFKVFDVDFIDPKVSIAKQATLQLIPMGTGMTEWENQWYGDLGKILRKILEINGVILSLRGEADSGVAADFYVDRLRPISQAALIHQYLPWNRIKGLVPEDVFTQRVKDGTAYWRLSENGQCELVNTVHHDNH